ncbi:MAG: hypothetical protein V3U97_05410 [bacterium]
MERPKIRLYRILVDVRGCWRPRIGFLHATRKYYVGIGWGLRGYSYSIRWD